MPPVWPSPRPDSCGTATPHAATSGASGSVILSPTPPVECLSAVGRDSPEKSIRSPLAIIACGPARDLSRSMPLSRIAIASADICSGATTSRVYASTTQSICSSLSRLRSRLVAMTSGGVEGFGHDFSRWTSRRSSASQHPGRATRCWRGELQVGPALQQAAKGDLGARAGPAARRGRSAGPCRSRRAGSGRARRRASRHPRTRARRGWPSPSGTATFWPARTVLPTISTSAVAVRSNSCSGAS